MNRKESKPRFEFKEIDHEGLDTLDVIAGADKLNSWVYETIKPFSKGRVLEIGSGIGNISSFYLKDNFDISLSDVRDNYCEILRKKFCNEKNLREVLNLDLVAPDFDVRYQSLFGSFNTIFALNVVEHIENDRLAIKNANKLLATGGNLIILVPAFQFLYNRFDKELYHFRRYTKSVLTRLFINEGISIIKSFYFNAAGIAGWFVSGKIQKNKTIPKNQIDTYNKLVPVFKFIDLVLFNQVGLSVITVGKKIS